MNIAYRVIPAWMIKELANNLDEQSTKDMELSVYPAQETIELGVIHSEYVWCAYEDDGTVYGIGGMGNSNTVWLLTSEQLQAAKQSIKSKFARTILKNIVFYFKNTEAKYLFNYVEIESLHSKLLTLVGAKFSTSDVSPIYFEIRREDILCGR